MTAFSELLNVVEQTGTQIAALRAGAKDVAGGEYGAERIAGALEELERLIAGLEVNAARRAVAILATLMRNELAGAWIENAMIVLRPPCLPPLRLSPLATDIAARLAGIEPEAAGITYYGAAWGPEGQTIQAKLPSLKAKIIRGELDSAERAGLMLYFNEVIRRLASVRMGGSRGTMVVPTPKKLAFPPPDLATL